MIIKKLFYKSSKNNQIDSDKIKGAIFGIAIGEALGIQVKNKTSEELHKYPLTDFVSYTDYVTAGGEFGYYTNQIINDLTFAQKSNIESNIFIEILSSFFKEKSIKNIQKKYTNKDNLQLLYAAYLVVYIMHFVNSGYPITKAFKFSQKKARYYSKYKIKRINMKNINFNYTEILLTQHIFNTKYNNLLKSILIVINNLFEVDKFEKNVLQTINLGFNTDISGAISGLLAGFMYGYSNIPKSWKMQMKNFDTLLNVCNIIS